MANVLALAQVWLWGRFVGAVSEEDNGTVTFEYDPEFARLGPEISPIKLPLSLRGGITFPELRRVEAFLGLPGVLADALPDRFGNAIIRKYFENQGRPDSAMSPVQKLLYLGNRAMGALEFRPPLHVRPSARERESLDVASLVEAARKLIEGTLEIAVPEIMRVGASAGGARPKAVILWNRKDNIVRSGFAKPRSSDEHWIIKFDGVGELDHPNPKPQPFNRVEYVYWLMAKAAYIEVPEARLLEERTLTHLMVKRFDRENTRRIHMHSLGGLEHVDYNEPGLYSYEQYLRAVLKLNLGHEALEQAYRRATFNIIAVNQDDHVKNLSFLMDEQGRWRLSPAYDLTYAKGAGFTRKHQMTLGGKQDSFSREDLLRLGEQFGIREDGASVIDEVAQALSQWPALARKWGVPQDRIDKIRSDLRLLRATKVARILVAERIDKAKATVVHGSAKRGTHPKRRTK